MSLKQLYILLLLFNTFGKCHDISALWGHSQTVMESYFTTTYVYIGTLVGLLFPAGMLSWAVFCRLPSLHRGCMPASNGCTTFYEILSSKRLVQQTARHLPWMTAAQLSSRAYFGQIIDSPTLGLAKHAASDKLHSSLSKDALQLLSGLCVAWPYIAS